LVLIIRKSYAAQPCDCRADHDRYDACKAHIDPDELSGCGALSASPKRKARTGVLPNHDDGNGDGDEEHKKGVKEHQATTLSERTYVR
jgi:hypothetical protein